AVGDIIVDRQLAMHRDRPAVAVVHRVVRAPGTVGEEVAALYTWRDGHGERYGNGPPRMERGGSGLRFGEADAVAGPASGPGAVRPRNSPIASRIMPSRNATPDSCRGTAMRAEESKRSSRATRASWWVVLSAPISTLTSSPPQSASESATPMSARPPPIAPSR